MPNLGNWKPLLEKIKHFGFGLRQRKKFILSIGDEGALLTYINDGEVEHFISATLNAADKMQALHALLALYSSTPLYILVDSPDQTYAQHTLPGVNLFSIGNVVKRKLTREFPVSDIKNALQLQRLKTGRKDWQYLFISTPNIEPLSSWIDMVMTVQNPIGGIFMLPLETSRLLAKLNTVIFPADTTRQQSSYQILLTHDKVSGFRQTAFKNGLILFTRVIDDTKEADLTVTTTILQQEMLNALEYLRRLSFQDSEGLDVFIIVSDTIKQQLLTLQFQGRNVVILTPFEASSLLALPHSVTEDSGFSDTLIAATFATTKPTLPFYTPFSQKLASLQQIQQTAFIATFVFIAILLLFSALNTFSLISAEETIGSISRRNTGIEQQWRQEDVALKNIKNSSTIQNMVGLYKLLSAHNVSPLAILADFNAIQGNNITVSSLDWSLDFSSQRTGGAPPKDGALPPIKASFNVEFHNTSMNLEGMIKNFNAFTAQLKSTFASYDVTYPSLPDKLNFDLQNTILPVQVTISGPKQRSDNKQ